MLQPIPIIVRQRAFGLRDILVLVSRARRVRRVELPRKGQFASSSMAAESVVVLLLLGSIVKFSSLLSGGGPR